MLKNWKDKILSFAAAVMLACGGAAAVNTVKVANNNDVNSGDVVSSMEGLFEGVEFGWVSSNVVSGKAEDVATEEPSLEIVSQNMQFQSKLYLMFAVHKANTDAEVKMLYWVNPQTEYTIETNDEEVSKSGVRNKEQDRVIEGKPCEIFNFPIRSTDMARVIYVRAYVEIPMEDGTTEIVYSDTMRYSAIDYVYKKKADGVEHTYEKLLDAMLAYGASAQIHFGLDKADLEGTEENAAKYVAETERVATDDYYMVTVESGALSDGFNSGRFTVKEKIDIQAPEENEEGLPFLCWQDQVGNYYYEDYYEDKKLISLSGITQDIVLTPVYLTKGWTFVNKVDSYYITKYEGNDSDIIIPAKYKGLPVTLIAMNAFSGCTTVKSIEIPSSIESIGSLAFNGCTSLEQITLSEGLQSIGKDAFNGCKRLKTIHIPSTVRSISDSYAPFYGCAALEEITVAAGNTKYCSIDGNLYNADGTVLLRYAIAKEATELRIPNGVKTIAASAIRNAKNLQKIYIPATVTSVAGYAIKNCSKNAEIYYAGEMDILNSWDENWNIDGYVVQNWE